MSRLHNSAVSEIYRRMENVRCLGDSTCVYFILLVLFLSLDVYCNQLLHSEKKCSHFGSMFNNDVEIYYKFTVWLTCKKWGKMSDGYTCKQVVQYKIAV